MHDLIAVGWAWVIVCEGFLLVLGVVNLITYRSNVPESAQSFAAVRSSENDFRSIVAPAIAALVTGLLVSVSATYAYDALRGKGEDNIGASFGFLMVALVILVLLLQPLMRGELSTEKLAQHPQRIYLAAKSITGMEQDAPVRISRLRTALKNWTKRSAAYSMGWPAKAESPLMNKALKGVPANAALPLWPAWCVVWRTGVVWATLRTAPWRFGWPLSVLLVPLALVATASFILGWPEMSPIWGIVVIVAGVVSLVVYWAGVIVVGVRRLAIARSFLPLCDAEFENAERRVMDHVARQTALSTIPAQLQAITAGAKRSEKWAVIGALVGILSAVTVVLRGFARR